MEKINNGTTVKMVKNTKEKKENSEKAEKGTVTVRKRGNSYEARIRLELKHMIRGLEKNPRLSRSGTTEEIARLRLAELIIETFIIKNIETIQDGLFSAECEENLKSFTEYANAKERILNNKIPNVSISFADFSVMWLNYKKELINPSTGKTVSPKTIESYAFTLRKYIVQDFSTYTVSQMTKEVVEKYINDVRKRTPRMAKDIFLMIRQVLNYAVKKGLIEEVPEFELKFPKKKRSKKKKLIYIPAERQNLWLDILEEDGRGFCKLFATLLQTGMRPEEGCGLLLSNIAFDRDMVYVGNAHKEITLYDYNFNVIGHESVDDGLKTDESYREIPMNSRLKKMLEDIYNERKELRILQNKKFEPEKEYAFLNTEGGPFLPERLDKKLKSIMHKYNLEHMTVYGFRHSFATLMSENGMDKEVLREIMGHADFETTDFYYIFISDKRKKEELMKAHKNAFGKQQLNDVQKNEQIDENSDIKKVKFTGKIIKKKKIKAPLGKSA